MTDWQPIETAPKDGTPILAHSFAASDTQVIKWEEGSGWLVVSEYGFFPDIWQPLPPPPK